MTTASTDSLNSEQKAQMDMFLSKPVNCKLFVEKISVKNNIKESEYRKAEVLLERNTPKRGQEFFVHYVEFNKRLDEWVSISRLDFTREITFPIIKKKTTVNKKSKTGRESSQTPVGSTPPPQSSTPTSSSTIDNNNTNQSNGQKRKWTDIEDNDDDNNINDNDSKDIENDKDIVEKDESSTLNKNKDTTTSIENDKDTVIIKEEQDSVDEHIIVDNNKVNKNKIKEEEEEEEDEEEEGSTPNPKSTFSKKDEIEQLRTSGSMTQCVSEIARIKNFNLIQMGKHEVETWYFSPYPVEYAYCDTLYICEFCLSFYESRRQLERHRLHCQLHHPPGNEIYRYENVSFFEIDGRKQRTWCRNLCLLSKLFLDHKTLYYDVDPFLFYCMTERDAYGYHLIGYFSKEKESSENYNVACILTLPQYQRMGFGKLLIAFSYELSKVEGKTGSPEKPLSDLGLLTYRAYWQETIVAFLLAATDEITIEEISQHTSITTQDILHTLNNIGALRYYRGQHIICLGEKVIEQFERNQQKKKKRVIASEKLEWKPVHFTPSQLRYL